MAVRVYRSTDTSAPVLTGTVGSLVALLDAVLVNGYGALAAAGWTIAYTAVNKRQYAMAAGGTGMQMFVDDSGPGAAGAKEARFNGFKTGTALGAGTGQFPSTSQMAAPSGALVIRKSVALDSVARAWTVVANGQTIYMFIDAADWSNPNYMYAVMFGDFFSYSSNDTNNCIIIGRKQENQNGNQTANDSSAWPSRISTVEVFSQIIGASNTMLSDVCQGHYVASNYTGVGVSVPVGKHTDHSKMGMTIAPAQLGYLGSNQSSGVITWTNEFNYPNAPDGGLYVAPIWVHHGGFVRGYLKGLWAPLQHLPLSNNDTYSGTGNLAGKSMIAQQIMGATTYYANNPTPCQVHVETSDTWS